MKRKTYRSDSDYRERFAATNSAGAERFGPLWLAATEEAVRMFRDAEYTYELERAHRLRSAIAASLFRVLLVASKHPITLKSVREFYEERKRQRVATSTLPKTESAQPTSHTPVPPPED